MQLRRLLPLISIALIGLVAVLSPAVLQPESEAAAPATPLALLPTQLQREPRLTLSQERVVPGEPIEVNGQNFEPGQVLTLRLNAPGPNQDTGNIGTVVVDEQGQFAATVLLPDTWPGSGAPLIEQELRLVAVHPLMNQALARASVINLAARPADVYRPAPVETCERLSAAMLAAFGIQPNLVEAPFGDYIAGGSGQGCQITVEGTGKKFGSIVDAARIAEELFSNGKWSEDPAYVADGPTATALAMRQGAMLALVNVSWEPAPGVSCPEDQPISACKIKPEEQLFTVTVNVATLAAEESVES